MEEAVISWTIQQLEGRRAEIREPLKMEVEAVLDELRRILDFLRDKKPREGGKRLHYLILDVLEMAMGINQIDHTIDYFNWEIKYVRSWLLEARRRMLQFGDDGAETEPAMGSEEARGDGEDLVGLEEDVETMLRDAIFKEEEGLRIIFIIGMVGVGKTALARQLYNHAAVVDQFDYRDWVCASGDLTQNEVLRRLIRQVVDREEFERDSLLEKMELVDNRGLHRMLCQLLQGKRYFIVLDDPPKQLRWESIVKGLPSEDKSIFLVSGRHHPTRYIHYMYQMKPLDAKKSWQLFLKAIFGNEFTSEHEFPKHLEARGKEMLKKCDGLPLAIKEVGTQLAKKRQAGSEWEELLESIDLGSTFELMDLFYHKLDPQMKLCFLHLAFFKENTNIRVGKFLQIWAAVGMVPKSEIGGYFYNLIRESIIEIKDKTSTDHVMKSFRVNIVLHLLCMKKAEEETGFRVLRSNGNSRPSQSPHHRVISCNREKFDYSTNEDKHLISLFFHGGGHFDSTPSYWKRLEELRILDFEDFGLKFLPESIGMLIELLYLGLRNNYIQELPQSLGHLKKLEVLDIAQNFMTEVPDIVWELCSLRQLYMTDVILRMPSKIDVLRNLMTLTYISVHNWTNEISGLHMMTSLRKLGIEELDGNSDVIKLFASLAKLGNLQSLILRGFRFRSMPCLNDLGALNHLTHLKLDGPLPRLPNADNFPPNISCLKLINTHLDEDPMPVLGKLSKLFHLKLQNAYTGQQMTILQGAFHILQVMCINDLGNLRNLQVGEGATPKLAYLVINNCPHLETLPEEIGSSTVLNLKMATTRNITRKIRNTTLISKILVMEINP